MHVSIRLMTSICKVQQVPGGICGIQRVGWADAENPTGIGTEKCWFSFCHIHHHKAAIRDRQKLADSCLSLAPRYNVV